MNWEIHHVTMQVHDARKAGAFYRDIIGLQNGKPHNIGTAGTDLNVSEDTLAVIGDGNRGLHLLVPQPFLARNTGMAINPGMGGHVAIAVQDLAGVKRRLGAAGVFYQDAGQYAAPGWAQIYLYDPSGNLIEVNQTL